MCLVRSVEDNTEGLVGEAVYEGPDGSSVTYRVFYNIFEQAFFGYTTIKPPFWFVGACGEVHETDRITKNEAIWWILGNRADMARFGKDTAPLMDLAVAVDRYTTEE